MDFQKQSLLKIKNLKVHFPLTQGILFQKRVGVVRAVDGASFELKRGETLGLVGESGCGKSTAGRAILQLIRPTEGQVFFEDKEISALWKKQKISGRWTWNRELRLLRCRMQMIFQDPYASLNPRMTVEDIIGEPLITFGAQKGAKLRREVQELMKRVGLDPRYVRRYPHEFSGGQRQRIGIARSLALKPDIIIADEPVSALDVSIQAQILNLLKDLQKEFGLTYIFIAHDLAAVRYLCDRIAVMYLGNIVEIADQNQIYKNPAHPYTKALIAAIPIPDPKQERSRSHVRLSGDVPSLIRPPTGCAFHPRCPDRFEPCDRETPKLIQIKTNHLSSCHLHKS